ncbi:MAG: nucleoside phosphorylase [Lachnospiraceae bacterium]|nr:nucleoside phosphorylase [Lachnospiraceae bacterium]
MSLLDSYDESKPLIVPGNFCKKGNYAKKCIVTFSNKVVADAIKRYPHEIVARVGTCNGKTPIYLIDFEGEKILLYMSLITAPAAGSNMEEVAYMTGATQFIVFGSCGSLDELATKDKFIIPTESYRGEGYSFYYVPKSDYIEIKNHSKLKAILDEMGLPTVEGKSFTTDALYRETETIIAQRKKEGCICVEMESSALQALCINKGYEFYTFFYISDLVGTKKWQNVCLGKETEKLQQINCFDIALQIAKRI